MNTTEKPNWVVYDSHIYRADHKPAPFTDSEGKHHPDFHDGLVALVYDRHHASLIASAPMLLAALESVIDVLTSPETQLEYLKRTHASAASFFKAQELRSKAIAHARAVVAEAKGEPKP